MPPGENQDIGVGELSRQVREVLVRFEGLAARLETQFVRSDNFGLYKQLVDQALVHLQSDASELKQALEKLPAATDLENLKSQIGNKASTSSVTTLEERIKDLEDDRRWLTRTVIGFIVLGVLGAVFVAARLTGGQ